MNTGFGNFEGKTFQEPIGVIGAIIPWKLSFHSNFFFFHNPKPKSTSIFFSVCNQTQSVQEPKQHHASLFVFAFFCADWVWLYSIRLKKKQNRKNNAMHFVHAKKRV